MASGVTGAPLVDSELRWHPEIEKVANFGNDHYFAFVNNTPWSVSISSGTAGDHINGLTFNRVVESGECYTHVCSKFLRTFSSGGTFCIKAGDSSDIQFIDFALSNPIITGRKIRALPVDTNEYGKLAWPKLNKTDTIKQFVYQNLPCVVKGEIQPGQNGYYVWKFCIQVSEVREQSQTWTVDGNNVKLTINATGFGTLSYQWMKDGEYITTIKHPNCTGSDTSNIIISPFSSDYEGNYSCRISDQAGQSIESKPITIRAQTVKYDMNGATVNVSATVPGTVSYTWMKHGEAITFSNHEANYNSRRNDQADVLKFKSEFTDMSKSRDRTPPVVPPKPFSKSESPIRYAAQKLVKKVEEWEENFVVQAAKRLANLMKELEKYLNDGEFDEKQLTDLLSRIIEISKEMVMVANRAAEACTKRHPKQDVMLQVDIIKHTVDFLEVLAGVNASRLKNGDTDAKERLTHNATRQLDAVGDIIQAIDIATLTLSDEAREQLDLPKWVKLVEKEGE